MRAGIHEHGSSRWGRRLARHRLGASAAVAAVEGVLVLTDVIPWLAVVAAAAVATALYGALFRKHANPDARAIAWVAATSQLLVVLVPVLAFVALAFAVGLVVLLALVVLVALLRDRR